MVFALFMSTSLQVSLQLTSLLPVCVRHVAWNVQVLLVFCIARCALTLWLFSHWHHIQTYRGAGSFRLSFTVSLCCR